jgi:hypothetical protein
MFDLEKVKAESGLETSVLSRIEQEVRDDFDDEVMFELHFIWAIHAVKDRRLTIEQLFEETTIAA